ncbi:MAG: homoserine dehydrogenase, partial [Planctomycetaceae bacterium]|nr:homoserine dehydrogenase [Planctomycetaceae bacterium]
SRMEEAETNYEDAVSEAQQRGYAEADPTMDVDGTDAVQKLSILAHLAFGARPRWNEIPRTGIQDFDPADLRYARELGYRIKLLAVAQLTESGLELHVSPTLVRHGTPLGEVRGAYNAVDVNGDAVGRVFFHGLGAGQMPTASAVMADMIDTALGRTQLTFRTLELWSQQAARVELADPKAVTGRYYLRLTADDHPGVLAEVTGILGRKQISIASVIQHEPNPEVSSPGVPLVIMTHGTTEGAMNQAVEALENLDSIRQKIVKMRILD